MTSAMQLIQQAKTKIRCIDRSEAKELMKHGDITLLDVREKVENDAGHIEGSEHISRGVLEMRIENNPAFTDRDKAILVYCKSGGRSALAAATLQEMGFSNVYSLEGGFDAWSKDQAIPEGIVD
jgi:rhodanese-related sulfurtransferase